MPMDYLKEGDEVTLPDGTFVEKNEKGTIVHNTPPDQVSFRNKIMESWLESLEMDKDHYIKGKQGEDVLLKDAILSKIAANCATQWGMNPNKIVNALKTIFLTPRYSSVVTDPTLNHPSESCRECAQSRSDRDKLEEFSLEDLLFAVEALHGCGKYVSHPHIELHGDGSGRIVGRYKGQLPTTEVVSL